MGILNDAGAWLAGKMQRAAGGTATIVYLRGAERIDLTGLAWVGRTVFSRVSSEAGASIVFGDRDYLVPVADLALDNGDAIEPERHDRIEETAGGVTRIYDVLAPSGEVAARYSDALRTTWRIHTVEHAAEPAAE